MNLERDFSTNTSKKERACLDSFSKVKRRSELRLFVAEYYKSVIHVAVLHLRLGSGLENFRFIVANKTLARMVERVIPRRPPRPGAA